MATHTAIIIPTSGPIREVTYSDKDSYATLSAGVGGTITTCPGFDGPLAMDAYANDNGFAEGLEVNMRVHRAIKDRYPYGIVGDVIIPKITPTKRAKLVKAGLLPA